MLTKTVVSFFDVKHLSPVSFPIRFLPPALETSSVQCAIRFSHSSACWRDTLSATALLRGILAGTAAKASMTPLTWRDICAHTQVTTLYTRTYCRDLLPLEALRFSPTHLCVQVFGLTGVSCVRRLSRSAARWSLTCARSMVWGSSTRTVSAVPRSLCVRTAALRPAGLTSTSCTCAKGTRKVRHCVDTTANTCRSRPLSPASHPSCSTQLQRFTCETQCAVSLLITQAGM